MTADNLFGTDGIRGTIGTSPFTQSEIAKIGYTLGLWLQKKYGNNPKILLAHDTRQSCSFVKSALKSGLLLFPITIYDAGTLPTPTICYLTHNNPTYDCGIIISASHNPYQDNGIKIIDKKNGKLTADDELLISKLFHTTQHTIPYTHFGNDYIESTAKQEYIEIIQNMFSSNFLSNLTIVLDCAHGAVSEIAPIIFNNFGARIITINNQPNGININDQCGALFTNQLQKTVLKHNADIGFAFDGDGDRVIAINKNGTVKNGDDILALLISHPIYKEEYGIIGTVMSNEGLSQFLKENNKFFFRSSVGDKYVSQMLTSKSLKLGGEPSGHIIMQDYLGMGDGILTALRILETMQITKNWKFKTFEKYPQQLINVPVKFKTDLSTPELNTLICYYKEKLPNGRLLTRYSGTENILRVMVEDKDAQHAQIICTELSHALTQKINKIQGV